jgi:AraC-like DNA-binding protein
MTRSYDRVERPQHGASDMNTSRVRFDQTRCVQRVQEALANLQDGVPSLYAITRQLGISERTLRRRLKSVGTSYNEILKEMRAAAAKNLLQNKMVTVDRVAAQLGYSESANFRHAFKRWTGQSPQSYRTTAGLQQIDLCI